MNLVIDASVFLGRVLPAQTHYPDSRLFFAALQAREDLSYSPVLAWAECAGALVRRTKNSRLGERMVTYIRRIPRLEFVPMSAQFAHQAADVAAAFHLRGSDACYVALAVQLRATLVTWDVEMLDRGAAAVTAVHRLPGWQPCKGESRGRVEQECRNADG